MDDLNGKTWQDDLGDWEHVRIEPANEENGIVERATSIIRTDLRTKPFEDEELD